MHAVLDYQGNPYGEPAFTLDQPAVEYRTGQPETYVRVFNDNPNPASPAGLPYSEQAGPFLMREQDLLDPSTGNYLTPVQIMDKFALPEVPTKITDVTVPPNFRMQTGEAAANVWGGGGATQFKAVDNFRDDVNPIIFTNPRPLP